MTEQDEATIIATAVLWLEPILSERGCTVSRCRFYVEPYGPRPIVYVELSGNERMVYTDGKWRHLERMKL